MRRLSLCSFAMVALVVGYSSIATAQVFAGGGALWGTDSANTRLLFSDKGPCSGLSPLLEGGAFFSRYVGVGAEWLQCQDVDSSVGGRVSGSAKESENIITTSVRVRFPANDWLSVHALAGAGVIRSDVMQVSSTFDIDGSLVTRTFHEAGGELALTAGIDFLLKIAPHVSGGPSLRIYSLRRPSPGPLTASDWTGVFTGLLIRSSW